MEEPRPMIVYWTDSSGSERIHDLAEMHNFKCINMATIGFGLEKEDRYVLAKEMPGDDFRHITAIPKTNITKVTILRKWK